jgi:hypothetical protein
MTQLLKNPDTAGVTPTSKNGASLLTADGAGTLATKTPHLALSHQPGHLAYSEDGGAALHDTSYVYDKGNIGFEPPSPPLNSYTPPPIGMNTPPLPSMNLLQISNMPPFLAPPNSKTPAYNPYNPSIQHPMFSNQYAYNPQNLPVSMHSGMVITHHPIVIPNSPGNGYSSFVHHHPMDQTSTVHEPNSLFPHGTQTPYNVYNGISHFSYPGVAPPLSFLQEQNYKKELPGDAKWIQPPDPKHRFGAGVPVAPLNDIRPAVGTAPFPGIASNEKGRTAHMYGSNHPSKYEDPHPPPGNHGPAWNHQSSVENPQYQQTNTFVKPIDPSTKVPQFSMPKRLRRRR